MRTYHLVDDVDGVAEVRGLEPRGRERAEQPREAEARVVEVDAGDPREALVVEVLRRFQQDGAHVFQGVHHVPGRDTSFSRRGRGTHLCRSSLDSSYTAGAQGRSFSLQGEEGRKIQVAHGSSTLVPLYSSGVVLDIFFESDLQCWPH